MNTPSTFQAHGESWYPHIPGEPMPCPADAKVETLMRMELKHSQGYTPCIVSGDVWDWSTTPENPGCEIIGWRYADEQPTEKDEAAVKGEQVTHVLGVAMMKLTNLRAKKAEMLAAISEAHAILKIAEAELQRNAKYFHGMRRKNQATCDAVDLAIFKARMCLNYLTSFLPKPTN